MNPTDLNVIRTVFVMGHRGSSVYQNLEWFGVNEEIYFTGSYPEVHAKFIMK